MIERKTEIATPKLNLSQYKVKIYISVLAVITFQNGVPSFHRAIPGGAKSLFPEQGCLTNYHASACGILRFIYVCE